MHALKFRLILPRLWPRSCTLQVGGLYAGEEVTAVGQQGAWLHVRLYEFDEDEEDKDDDNDVSRERSIDRLGALGYCDQNKSASLVCFPYGICTVRNNFVETLFVARFWSLNLFEVVL